MKAFSAAACAFVLASGLAFPAGAAPAGRPALFLSAIDSGDAESVKALIPLSDINKRFDAGKGDTPLTAAARKGHTEIVRMLLRAGASIEGRNKSGGTALLIAAQGGKTETVKLLLKEGADMETKWQGRTPLIQAARWGHGEVIRVLLEAGADRNARSEGMNAAGFAGKYGWKEALAVLEGAPGRAPSDTSEAVWYFEAAHEPGSSFLDRTYIVSKGKRLAVFSESIGDINNFSVYRITKQDGGGISAVLESSFEEEEPGKYTKAQVDVPRELNLRISHGKMSYGGMQLSRKDVTCKKVLPGAAVLELEKSLPGGGINYASGDCFTFYEEIEELGEALFLSLAVRNNRAYFLYDGPGGVSGAVYEITDASGNGFTGIFIRPMHADDGGGYFGKRITVRYDKKKITLKNMDNTTVMKRELKYLQETVDRVSLKNQ